MKFSDTGHKLGKFDQITECFNRNSWKLSFYWIQIFGRFPFFTKAHARSWLKCSCSLLICLVFPSLTLLSFWYRSRRVLKLSSYFKLWFKFSKRTLHALSHIARSVERFKDSVKLLALEGTDFKTIQMLYAHIYISACVCTISVSTLPVTNH